MNIALYPFTFIWHLLLQYFVYYGFTYKTYNYFINFNALVLLTVKKTNLIYNNKCYMLHTDIQ